MFDDSLKKTFDDDGFVVLRGFLNAEELATVRIELDRVIREVVPKMPREHVFYEDKGHADTLKQLQCLHSHDAFFHNLFIGSRIEQLAEALLGEPVVGKNFQFFSKPPGTGQPTPPHQDGFYFKLTPCAALTMWLALDDVDQENGCVNYVRGSNLSGMRAHDRSNVLGFSQKMIDYGRPEDLANAVDVPARPGDLLAHHALTIHSAGGNRSASRPRRSLGAVYFAASAQQDTEEIAAYQQKLKSELSASGRI